MLMPKHELYQGDWWRITRPQTTRPTYTPRNLTLTCCPGCSGGLILVDIVSTCLYEVRPSTLLRPGCLWSLREPVSSTNWTQALQRGFQKELKHFKKRNAIPQPSLLQRMGWQNKAHNIWTWGTLSLEVLRLLIKPRGWYLPGFMNNEVHPCKGSQ